MKGALAKVYAAFSPAGTEAFSAVEKAGKDALGHDEAWLFLEGDMLRIAWEGLYFPLDEVLEALRDALQGDVQGRLDYLDLEAWTLRRFVYEPGPGAERGRFIESGRGLNQVLEYSGH